MKYLKYVRDIWIKNLEHVHLEHAYVKPRLSQVIE